MSGVNCSGVNCLESNVLESNVGQPSDDIITFNRSGMTSCSWRPRHGPTNASRTTTAPNVALWKDLRLAKTFIGLGTQAENGLRHRCKDGMTKWLTLIHLSSIPFCKSYCKHSSGQILSETSTTFC